jgi:hypothetical protein
MSEMDIEMQQAYEFFAEDGCPSRLELGPNYFA